MKKNLLSTVIPSAVPRVLSPLASTLLPWVIELSVYSARLTWYKTGENGLHQMSALPFRWTWAGGRNGLPGAL